jgi:type II secretion system protein D
MKKSALMYSAAVMVPLAMVAASGRAWALQPATPPAPAPVEPPPAAAVTPAPAAAAPAKETQTGPRSGRRKIVGGPTVLAFKQFTVEQMVPFIVESTGKPVIPMQDIMTRKVTVINDQPIPREQALDLVYMALLQNNVAVIETESRIMLRDVADIPKSDVPVIGPNESVLDRTDLGSLAEKVFALKHNTAKSLSDALKDKVPDYAKLAIDEESNQVLLMGNIALLQRVEHLVESLDRPAAGALQTETFRLRYADSEVIKANIEELYSANSSSSSGSGGGGGRRRNNNGGNNNNNQPMFRFPGQGGADQTAAASDEMRVSSNTQQNSVTVVADAAILKQIHLQLENFWDKPLPDEAVIPKVYDLKNTDPVKVANLLEAMFGKGGSSRSTGTTNNGGGPGGNQGGTSTASSGSSQGVGRLAGQFSFQAVPEAGRLVVVAKSPDNITVIDKIIAQLDQPQTAGLPAVVELKHANAEDLAEQLNALLAADGTTAQVRRASSGLTAATAGASPFSTANTSTSTTNQAADPTQSDATAAGNLSFWWQRSRSNNERDKRNPSNLIGNIRIVPVWRQNALLVVAPPEYKQSIIDMIDQLDRPGRQVLIAAILASVSVEDATSLGLRWSNQSISPTKGDNAVSLNNSFQGSNTDFANSLFRSSVLQSNINVNVLLQALAEKSAVSVLSEPKIFTSDNQEATFFDGQDTPFISNSQTTTQGNQIQSFDYKAVGIALRARPRITINGDVDLRVNVEISSIVPGQTLFGGFIINRRETTTQLIIKDRQTVVISGIMRQDDSDIVRKVPILGDILPFIFKSREKSRTNSELLVFITPVVVNNSVENEGVSTPYRDRLEKLKKDLSIDPNKFTGKPEDSAPTPHAPANDGSPAAAEAPK